jgi:hypothetical protein
MVFMNKEVLVAIIIGIVLGLGGALYLNKQKLFSNTPVSSVATTQVKILTKAKETSLITYKGLPANNAIVTKGTLSVEGNSKDFNLLVAANELGVTTKELKKQDNFKLNVDLKPGLNRLLMVAHGPQKENEKLKVMTLYYLKEVTPISSSDDEEEREATDEAALLKERLEKKVMELRRNAKQAYTGKVKSISDKEAVIDDSGTERKIALEPEVTRYYEIDGEGMTDLEEGDIEKGDTITTFISDIAGDKKSYTVYREPSVLPLYGKVSNVDTANYQVSIINFDKATYKVDVETSTVQSLYDLATHEIEKYGFSKLKIADHIYAVINQNDTVYSFDEYLVLQPKE